MFKTYYRLIKPGIIYGNIMTATAGFLFASKWQIHFGLLLATLSGTALIIASACVCNNYTDRHIDRLMFRTKQRALVTGTVSNRQALVFAAVIGVAGTGLLLAFVNQLTCFIGLAAFFIYVGPYAMSKRNSVHSTLVGALAGAAPPVAGYTAVTNQFDAAALVLFIILVAWQMPHFYAIAMYRADDYRAAGLPVLPVKYSLAATKRQMMAYIVIFTVANLSLTKFGYTHYTFLVASLLLGGIWFYRGLRRYNQLEDAKWARQMFFVSLFVLIGWSAALAVGSELP